MIKINLIVLSNMAKQNLTEEVYREHTTTWIFDDYENYGLGCTESFIAIDEEVDYQSDDYTDIKGCYIENFNCNDCEYANCCSEYIPF
jgi:hypothetical protein